MTTLLVDHIVFQTHHLSEESLVKSAQNVVSCERESCELKERAERIRVRGPPKIKRVLNLAVEKGSSMWVTVLPLQEIDSNLINGRSVMLSNFAKTGSSMMFPPLVYARKSLH